MNITIIYCSNKQMNDVLLKLSNKILAHPFTMEEGIIPSSKYNGLSERSYLLKKFDEGDYKILVAMKCLDEGVDIPSAKNAILLANDGNPLNLYNVLVEFYEGQKAKIMLISMISSLFQMKQINKEFRTIEKSIFEKEMRRYL